MALFINNNFKTSKSMSCDFNSLSSPKTGTESRLSQLLFNRLNNNKSEVISVYETAVLNKEFKQWFLDNGGFEYDADNIDGRKVGTLIKKVKEFQNKFEFRISRDRNVDRIRHNVFPTVDMENHAINVIADIYLDVEDKLKGIGKAVNSNNIRMAILARLKKHYSNPTLTKNQKDFVYKMITSVYNKDSLFRDMLRQPRTIELSKSLGVLSENEITNDDEAISISDIMANEEYAKDWSDSIGERRSISKTISREVRRIFNLTKKLDSIEKVNGKNVYDYADNTYSGIAESINFQDYVRTIFNGANFDNIDSFIQSLHDLARSQKDRLSLEEIADKCESDKNIANLLYVNFNQPVIKRSSLILSEGSAEPSIDNVNSDPVLVLRNTILGKVHNSVGANISGLRNWIDSIKFIIDKGNINDKVILAKSVEFNNVESAIASLYNYIDLGISEEAINNYIQNETGTYNEKILNLYNNFNNLFSNLLESINNAKTNMQMHNERYKEWAKEKQIAIEAGEPIPVFEDVPENEKLKVITDKFMSNILDTSNMFAKYQDVKTELNSKNIEGELVADTIKHSYLTRFFQRMKNAVSAETYFKMKAAFPQYENSNILFETTDENGNIRIPGMLRMVNNQLVLTPYYRFLDMELFNGAKNEVLNETATYSAMSQADFDITAYNNYLNISNGSPTTQRVGDNSNRTFEMAKYFIQTPSDAPKTFVINSYKLGIKGLIRNDGTINRNHSIYLALSNILNQEIVDMRQAFETIFEVDENNNLVYEEETVDNYGKKSKPKLKHSKDNITKDLYKQYHYNGAGPVVNGKLTGNVFQFWNLLIDYNDKKDGMRNLNVLIDDSTKDNSVTVEGMWKFLYGGLNNSLNDYIDNYIKVKTEEAVKYFDAYKEEIDNYSPETAKEFVLNYSIQYINYTQLFSGNPKFYKDTRDTIKRNKEIQGSGLSYAAYSIDNYDITKDNDIAVINVGNKNIKVTNKFNYATIYNTIKPTDNIDGIVKRMKAGNVPENIIEFITGKYESNSKVNDAQSYITLDEFVRRVYLSGEYNNYKDTIEALYDETKPIDYEELGKLIQVQKNFYYELQADLKHNLEAPIQIKNAEFVLIPRFLGDSELSILNNVMSNNGIDQLNTAETEKAGQTGFLTFWDNNGNLTENNLNDFIKNLPTNTKIGYYNNLYKQQDTPQHMDDVNKAGVQIVKKMLDNLKGEKGNYLRNKFFDLFTTNIEESYEDLTTELGVSKDKNGNIIFDDLGNIVIDNTKFYDLIRDEFSRLGVDSNMMDYANIDVNGTPIMPNYMPMVRKKIMSIFQSIFTSNVTRQTLPGFHAAQVTNVGFDKAYKQSDYEAKTGSSFRKLRYHPDGSDYVEVMIPVWKKGLIKLYEEKGELLLEDLEKEGLTDMIGYRIPTEGKQSVVKMKVVGLLDYTQGSTIIVPDEFVAQTGADFDIDSVYGIYKDFYINKNGKIRSIDYIAGTTEEDNKKRYTNYINDFRLKSELSSKELLQLITIEDYEDFDFAQAELLAKKENKMSFDEFKQLPVEKQNSRAARNNEILNTFLEIMNDSSTSEENFMSSNFDDIVDAKRKIYDILGLSKEWIDINSFIGQSNYRNQVMSGATLKAISVKRDGFCSISNVAKTVVNKQNAISVIYDISNSPVEETNKLIKTYGKDNVIPLEDNKVKVIHDKLGWSLNEDRNAEGKLLTVYSSETTALILDGVKEGGIMNVNTYTFDVFKTFIDLGIDYETAIAFITQPGITEIVKANDASNSIYINSKYNPIGAATKNLLFNYLVEQGKKVDKFTKLKDLFVLAEISDNDYKGYAIDKNHLKETLVPNKDKKVELIEQLRIIDNFRNYKILSDSIGAHANVMNTDKTGAGQSIYEVNKLINDIAKLKNKISPILLSNETNGSLINAVYPNIEFDKINIKDSVYRSLYAQLKYSVLGSKMITSQMFMTENDTFKQLKSYLPNNIDEDTAYAFENYVIAKALNESDFVNSNILIDKNGQILNNVTSNDTTGLENRRRITGYKQGIYNSFRDLYKNEEIDFVNPTKEQVDKFMMLSPANKVMLLKQIVKGESILDYINVELIDSRKANKGKQSSHRMIVKDNSSSPEQLYELFRDIYYKDNPFLKATADDMIRYAIVKEGLQYNYNFISKIIPNEVLYNNYTDGGTNIINRVNNYINNDLIHVDKNKIIDDFFRQYNDSKYIVKYQNKYNKKEKGANIIFDRYGKDIALLTVDKAREIGIIEYESENDIQYKRYIKTNKYVKGNKNPSLQLYKIVGSGEYVYLYPVNQLERNEIGDTSVNSDNAVYAQDDIYRGLIAQANIGETILPNNLNALDRARMNIGRNYVLISNTGKGNENLINRYISLVNEQVLNKDNFDIKQDTKTSVFAEITNLTDDLKRGILVAAEQGVKIMFYDGNNAVRVIKLLEDNGFTNYEVIGYNNNSPSALEIRNRNREDAIANKEMLANEYRANTVELNTKSGAYAQLMTRLQGFSGTFGLINRVDSQGVNYFSMTTQSASTLGLNPNDQTIVNINDKEYLITNIGYVNKKDYKTLPDYRKNNENKTVIEEAVLNAGFNNINLIKIELYDNAISNELENRLLESSDSEVDDGINDFIINQVQSVNSTLRFSDSEIAKDVKKKFRQLEIDRNNKNSLTDATRAVALSTTALFIEQHTNNLTNKFNNFNGYNITDPKLYDELINNPTLQQEFCKLLLDISTFIGDNELIRRVEKYSQADIDNAKTEAEKRALLDNNQAIETIRKLYNDVNSLRNKADVARDMFFSKVINKLSTNPLVQSELYDITKPYRDESWFQLWFTDAQESNVSIIQVVLKEVMKNIYTSENKSIDKIVDFQNRLNEIKKIDPNVNIASVIDKNGKLIRPFTDSFLDDMRDLREAAQEAKFRYGITSKEYDKAKREYEKWLTNNIDREYIYDYYKELEEMNQILDDYPEARKKIKEIQLQQSKILSNLINNDYSSLSVDEIKQLKVLARQLNNLKQVTDPDTGAINPNADEAVAIDRYLTARDAFNKHYNEVSEKEGFREKLTKNINTINALEATMTQEELDNSIDYQKAKQWINANTYKKVDTEYANKINEAFKVLKSVNSDSVNFKKLAEDKYDSEGIINGNLFTDADIELLGKKQKTGYSSETAGEGIQKLIRNNVGNDRNVYKKLFYDNIKGKVKGVAYSNIVKQINNVVANYFDPLTGKINTANMTVEELRDLHRLYTDLGVFNLEEKKGKPITDFEYRRKKFIRENVDFEYDMVEYDRQKELAKSKGKEYYAEWKRLNYMYNEFTESYEPNVYLYGYMKPHKKWIDEAKTNARKVIDDNIIFKNTKYYEQRIREEIAKGKDSFKEWYNKNHIFNPNTQRYEPIRVWQQMEYKDNEKVTREPKSKWLQTKVKDEFKNPNYKEGELRLSFADSKYINKEYDAIRNNQATKEMYDLVTSTLDELVIDKRSRSYINKGYIPSEPIKKTKENWRDYTDSILRSIGIYDTPMKSEVEEQFGKRNVNMPMLHRVQQEKLIPIRHQGDSETDVEYADYLKEVHAKNKEISKKNNEAHVAGINTNYEETFVNFIREAMKFNAIQDSSLLMRLTLEELNAMKYYKRNSKGGILYDNAKSFITGNTETVKEQSKNAVEHFTTQMKKLIYNEFELDQGNWSKFSRVARSITSAKFMMLNLTGGVSNITMGESQIFMETMAREFLGNADYAKGLAEYKKGLMAYFANSNRATSDNLTDALIKRIDVLNLDSQTDIAGGKETDLARKAMNWAYFQQSAGEHMMQNSTMLGMMYSHRVVKDKTGKSKLVTFEQYSRNVREDVLKDLLRNYDAGAGTDLLNRYNEFISGLKEEGNEEELQRYVYFTKDTVTEFVNTLPKQLRKQFVEQLKDKTKTVKEEFNALDTFISQFELSNGLAKLKKDSGLTYDDVSNFRNKVISVNHKIHGIYDKIGAAKAQGTWWGGIAFQFHKHMIPGWAKRYGYVFGKGVYNEAREAVDKGSYVSLYEFLKTPFKAKFNKSEVTDEINAIEGWRNFGNNMIEFASNARIYYNILPEYDKANIRRTLSEMATIMSSVLLFIGARMMWDEKEEDTQLADYIMYWSDRLASEAQQYTPVGAIQEGKKLYSNPVAAFANIKDAMNAFGAITDYMFTGDEKSLIYQSGALHGQNKLVYNLSKQIPIYNQYLKHEKLGKNNSYYKTGNNMIGFLPIRNWVDDLK